MTQTGPRALSGSLEVYAKQDHVTDPGGLAALYDDLPAEPGALRDIVSGLIIHVSWAAQYGISPDTAMPRETQSVADRLQLIQKNCPGPLAAERPAERRTFGTCRDYSLLLCSMLRQRSVPARVRCGFATYFSAGPYQDHWIVEYWIGLEQRWVRADAQLDQLHRDRLDITFDCADMPTGTFLDGVRAWTLVRAGAAAPDQFGHGDSNGLWFLRVNLQRDLLALTNQPMSAWDSWRNATSPSKGLSDKGLASADQLARAVEAAEGAADGIAGLRELAAMGQTPPWQG
ncbi:transglutaminase-like domain-containing protein [Phreatobacter stygius]|uniref:Transglutaminase domain-containing protein n=1 Tax=Phreatobacter stygius TaxID=1940610 RepID=A0A4D7AT65_9HYPH|nr:transglutaminase-like domain-containing protein [Phreatobacter stygius]QCI64129.1 transglutaminase domain-containing protein [Phreatobacter stygius]